MREIVLNSEVSAFFFKERETHSRGQWLWAVGCRRHAGCHWCRTGRGALYSSRNTVPDMHKQWNPRYLATSHMEPLSLMLECSFKCSVFWNWASGNFTSNESLSSCCFTFDWAELDTIVFKINGIQMDFHWEWTPLRTLFLGRGMDVFEFILMLITTC